MGMGFRARIPEKQHEGLRRGSWLSDGHGGWAIKWALVIQRTGMFETDTVLKIAGLVVENCLSASKRPGWVVGGLPGRRTPNNPRGRKNSTLVSGAAGSVRWEYEPTDPMLTTVLILALLTALVATEPAPTGERGSCES
jgi:hypothetical protein